MTVTNPVATGKRRDLGAIGQWTLDIFMTGKVEDNELVVVTDGGSEI